MIEDLQAEIDRLTNKVEQLYEGAEEQRQRIKRLERELNAANESFRKLNIHALDLAARIKRLEEAGSEAIYPIEYATRVRIWTKAKEAKP